MRRLAAYAVSATVASTLLAAGPAAKEYSLPIRIGVVAFDEIDSKIKDANGQKKALSALGSDRPVARYLHALAEAAHAAKPSDPAPRFQIYRGNYYQVMSWMENGDIDGAVLSPFMAMLATEAAHRNARDDARALPAERDDTIIVASFAYTPEASRKGTSLAYISARNSREELGDPKARYRQFIASLVEDARKGDEEERLPYMVSLVNHLSTSGFVLPLMHTHHLLHEALQREPNLEKQKVLARRFWDLYFQYVHLTLWHQNVTADGKTVFEFTYESSRSRPKLAVPYLDETRGADPNDVLVLRRRMGTSTYDTINYLQHATDVLDRAAADATKAIDGDVAELKARHESQTAAPFQPPHWYRFINRFDPGIQNQFESDAHALFIAQPKAAEVCAAPLHERWSKWYESGEYDFSAEEVIALLSHDQMIRNFEVNAPPAGALVLPGGGVRGTYQAALLDKLYDGNKLINFVDASDHRTPPRDGTVILRHIIGTSGGALVGFFAAQRHAGTAHNDALLNEWIEGDKVVATPDRIFPPVGLLRWISALVIVALYSIVTRTTFGRRESAHLPQGRLSPIVVFGIGLTIFLAPFVLWRLARADASYTPTFEGSFYCVLVLAGHAIFTITKCPAPKSQGKWIHDVVALFVAVMAVAGLAFIFFHEHELPLTEVTSVGVSVESLLAFAALLTILGAVLVHACAHDLIVREAAKAYLGGICVAAALIAIAWAFFRIGTYIEATSSIEMTVEYWIWIGAAAIAAGAILTGMAVIATERSRIYAAVVFWNEEHRDRRFLATPGQSLIAFGVTALVLWAVFAAPALYTSAYGFETFKQSAEKYRKGHAFLTNFVATTTSLGTAQVQSKIEYRGDYYVCLRTDEACNALHAARPAQVLRYAAQDPKEGFLNAVFASGSPFPIYPSRLLRVDVENAGMFMDGGYTHNTPIEAAHLLNAQQVLIVHSAQRADSSHGPQAGRTVSALASDSATLFPFLFDRSQALDQAVRANMFVASLAPYGGHRPDAFLMDFRESTVRSLRAAAADDFKHHRIGQVDSWGLPTRLLDDSAIKLNEPGA